MDFSQGSYPNNPKPMSDFYTGYYYPSNYFHHQFVPIVPGMYFQQYPMQNGFMHSHLYAQQQKYSQVELSRQNPQQREASWQVSYPSQIAPANTTLFQPHGHQDVFYSSSVPSYVNLMNTQSSSEQILRDKKADTSHCHPELSRFHESFDPNCTSSNNNNLETSPNNQDSPQNQSKDHSIRQETFQKPIKNEETPSMNETNCKTSTFMKQEYENYGSKPHKMIKMEYDQDNQNNSIKENSVINKIEKYQQNEQKIDQRQVSVKLEDTFKNLCKQEIEGEYLCQNKDGGSNSNNLQEEGMILPFNLRQAEEISKHKKQAYQSVEQLNTPSCECQNNLMLHLNKRPTNQEESNSGSKALPTIKNKQQKNTKEKLTQDQETQKEARKNQEELELFFQHLSEEDTKLIQQLPQIKVQNCFKNLIKGLRQTVNDEFTKIYVYDNPNNEALNGNNLKKLDVIVIEQPSLAENLKFSQKFNKYLGEKKINNTSIEQIVKNSLYSKILSDFLENYADRWIINSVLTNKEDNRVFLKFLQLAIKDHRYLHFLQKTQVISLTSNQ